MSIDSTTCPAQLRDECELRYVLSLPTKAERADYLDRAERFDGKASTDCLRQRVAAGWAAAREAGTPIPCMCEAAAAAASRAGNGELPVNGSSLVDPREGALRRAGGVVSEVAAR
ncbi:MAG: hypothetical protein J0M00_17575 [Burkholderiales bacterium]|nr:hypothetical protein [Burkholderiales bacterium]